MYAPKLAAEVVKKFEGLHRVVQYRPTIVVTPYLCPSAFWTIGFGHLCTQDHPPINEAQAEAYLAVDLRDSVVAALRQSPVLANDERRLSAITSFIFNLGAGRYQASTLKRRVNVADWSGAATEIRKWVFGGGRKLPGLVARREVEALLLENP